MNIQKLKKVIQEANPEIMELKFGCEVIRRKSDKEKQCFISDYYEDRNGKRITLRGEGGNVYEIMEIVFKRDFKILGRPIRLADVLLALKKLEPNHFQEAIRDLIIGKDIKGKIVYWNLKKDFDNQSDECKEFLIKLLVK